MRSGGGQESGTHDAIDVGTATVGTYPLGHAYVPTRHDDAAESGYEPRGHALHDEDPAAATEPGAHFTHVSEDVARRTLLALPAGHELQTVAPSLSA